MPDSNYASRCRHKRSFLPPHPSQTSGPSFASPSRLELVDDEWAAETFSDEDVDIPAQFYVPLSRLLDDSDVMGGDALIGASMLSAGASGATSADAAAVASATHSGAVAEAAQERRKKAERQWNELALDRLDALHVGPITRSSYPVVGIQAGSRFNAAAGRYGPSSQHPSTTPSSADASGEHASEGRTSAS